MGIKQIGGRLFYVYRVMLLKQFFGQYITADANINMYTFIFTHVEKEVGQTILTSFQSVDG